MRHISGSWFKFVTRGLRLILSVVREQKQPITPDTLRRICPLLSTDVDPGFWVADSPKSDLSRSDFFIRTWGPVCYGLKPCNSSSVVCWYKWFVCLRATLHARPAQANEHDLHCHAAPSSSPAFLKSFDGNIEPITYDALGTKLLVVWRSYGSLRERARWIKSCAVIGYLSGKDKATRLCPARKISGRKPYNKSFIDQTRKKEIGQYPAILTSHLVNNPYLLDGR